METGVFLGNPVFTQPVSTTDNKIPRGGISSDNWPSNTSAWKLSNHLPVPVTGILSNLHIDIKPNFLIFVCLITGHQPPTHDIIQPQCQLPVHGYWHNKLIDLKPQFLVFVCLAQVRLRDTRSSICKNSIDIWVTKLITLLCIFGCP